MADKTYLSDIKEIRVDENSPLFDKTGMLYKEFRFAFLTELTTLTAFAEVQMMSLCAFTAAEELM